MKIEHPAVTSSVFRLVDTVEVDLALAETTYTLRIELFQDTERADQYRARTWESELFRLVPSFPQDEVGDPTDECDDVLFVQRAIPGGMVDHQPFCAPSREAALDSVLDDLRSFLAHVNAD
jgi:hypothetical protein